jgi:hypothetical protein
MFICYEFLHFLNQTRVNNKMLDNLHVQILGLLILSR